MNYAKAIRTIRSAKNLSQQELANKVGLDASYISLIEKQKRIPTIKTLKNISDVLKVPFHLLTLLASDKEDLKYTSKTEAEKIGKELLFTLVSLEDEIK